MLHRNGFLMSMDSYLYMLKDLKKKILCILYLDNFFFQSIYFDDMKGTGQGKQVFMNMLLVYILAGVSLLTYFPFLTSQPKKADCS